MFVGIGETGVSIICRGTFEARGEGLSWTVREGRLAGLVFREAISMFAPLGSSESPQEHARCESYGCECQRKPIAGRSHRVGDENKNEKDRDEKFNE
jgi:hypothetical protein